MKKLNIQEITEDRISTKGRNTNAIAIIGIGIHVPGADDTDEFWKSLKQEKSMIVDFPLHRKNDALGYLSEKGYEKEPVFSKGAYLEQIDQFDYQLFQCSPKEAQLMDPNQRIFLQTAWSCLEDSGYGGDVLKGSNTGVFLGFNSNGLHSYSEFVESLALDSKDLAVTGNINPIIPSRLSYLMDFRGPSFIVDCACSSSLVTTHLACNALQNDDCDYALAGGIHIRLLPIANEIEIGIESNDFSTKAFDQDADGTVWGEGCGCILLKPLDKAVRDKDSIYAVIEGSAVNQDGNSIGLTAPNGRAQEELLLKAWRKAGIHPDQLSYLEAHGTGTPLGDMIEMQSIANAFHHFTDKKQFCGIGSVKTNYGHTDSTAGILGLIKTALVLDNREIPATLNFRRPNNKIDYINSPVFVNRNIRKLNNDKIHYAGVSAFGISGTNCHVILREQEQQRLATAEETGVPYVFTVSAKSESAFLNLIVEFKDYILNCEERLQDLCYTSNTGRGSYEYRLAIVAESLGELKNFIRSIPDNLEQMKERTQDEGNLFVSWKDSSIEFEEELLHYQEELNQLEQDAKKYIDMLAKERTNLNLIRQISLCYVKGANVDWDNMYPEKPSRIHMPTYQFDKTRCWLQSSEKAMGLKMKQLCYELCWKESSSVHSVDDSGKEEKKEIEIKEPVFFITATKKQKAFLETLSQNCENPVFVLEEDLLTQSPENAVHDLIETIRSKQIQRIVFAASLFLDEDMESVENLDNQLNRGLYFMFYVAKALIQEQQYSNLVRKIVVLTDNAFSVKGNEKINAANAALTGFAKNAAEESAYLTCKCIDIDDKTDVQTIWKDMTTDDSIDSIAYREGKRFVQQFEKLSSRNSGKRGTLNLVEKGTYLITGGLGGIGLNVAKHLAKKKPINLVLVNRTAFPASSEWEGICKKAADTALVKKIQNIQEIEKLGAKVYTFAGDITSESNVAKLIERVHTECGTLNGIIHCAGLPAENVIAQKSIESFKKVISAKVYGTLLLDQYTRKDKLDFFLLFSSINTLQGITGYSDYTSANTFLDSYASYMCSQGRRALAVDWTAWAETGMAFNQAAPLFFRRILPEQALEAMDYVSTLDMDRVIVGEIGEVDAQQLKMIKVNLSDELKEEVLSKDKQTETTQANDVEVRLKGRRDGKYTETEKLIAKSWNSILGLEEINIYDSFFDLGGDSILLTKVYESLPLEYKQKCEMTDMFTYPNINGLSKYISSKDISQVAEPVKETVKETVIEEKPEDDLDNLMDMLKNNELSSNELIDRLFSKENENA